MKKSNKWGTAALVLGILSLVVVVAPYFGLPIAILAVIFAGQQKEHTKNSQAGLILGIIGLVINGIMLLFMATFWSLITAGM